MLIKSTKPESKQDIIVNHIWDLYKMGSLTIGSFIPSERQLMIKFGFSRNTVRLAITRLVSSGYLKPIHGKGYRLRSKVENNISSFKSVFPDKTKTTKFIKAEETFGFHKESGIMDPVILYKYRCADDVAFMLTIQYVPKDIWIRINQRKAQTSLFQALDEFSETRPDYRINKSKKRISFVETPELAKGYLDSLHEMIIEFKSRTMAKNGVILEFSVNYYNSTYFTHSWTETKAL